MASVVAVAAAGVPRLLETDIRGTKNLVLGLAFRLGLLDGRNDPCFDASILFKKTVRSVRLSNHYMVDQELMLREARAARSLAYPLCPS